MCPVNDCDLKLNIYCKELNIWISLLILVFLFFLSFFSGRQEIIFRNYTHQVDEKNGILFSFRYGRKENIFKLAWRFFQASLPVYEKKTYFVHNLYEINNNLGQCQYSWILHLKWNFHLNVTKLDQLPKTNNFICILHVLWLTHNGQGTCVTGIGSYINL